MNSSQMRNNRPGPGTPLHKSQQRLKRVERQSLRHLQDVYNKCIDRGLEPPSPLKKATVEGLSTVAQMRIRHSARYYGTVDNGHACWADLLKVAGQEMQDYLRGDTSRTQPFRATTIVLNGHTAPTSPVKLPERAKA